MRQAAGSDIILRKGRGHWGSRVDRNFGSSQKCTTTIAGSQYRVSRIPSEDAPVFKAFKKEVHDR